ncbi:hypothetical protein HRI_001007100 [Hibiscus trionum]|uniref:Uncharacterized protein n=1 Tax=Hibiscus trionum TaxID=183268 RepID=A0A9W7H9W6_HIBTR|nr:hypothetical protein HRI_001007100 [Hibiscus trionum]
MEWLYPRRRGPQWKQANALPSVSAPPLPLLTIFGILILLLWFSQYTDYSYRAQFHNFQLFLLLFSVLLIFFIISSGRFAFGQRRLERDAGSSPWGMAVLLGFLFVLLSYQSSFHSKWFGPST